MTPAEELKLFASKHRWAFEELVFSEKMIEANQIASGDARMNADADDQLYLDKETEAEKLIAGPAQAMYDYLKRAYGSGVKVLDSLRHLVRVQHGRRKTLHLK